MIRILPFEKCDSSLIIDWNKEKTADFLQQWAGRGYEFPITEKQILDRIDNETVSDFMICKIVLENKTIGTIELMNIDKEEKKADIGRFLLNPSFAGKGYGTASLKAFTEQIFSEFNFNKLGLTVFDFNKAAFRCYEKAGFKIVGEETRLNGWIAIKMEISRPVK